MKVDKLLIRLNIDVAGAKLGRHRYLRLWLHSAYPNNVPGICTKFIEACCDELLRRYEVGPFGASADQSRGARIIGAA